MSDAKPQPIEPPAHTHDWRDVTRVSLAGFTDEGVPRAVFAPADEVGPLAMLALCEGCGTIRASGSFTVKRKDLWGNVIDTFKTEGEANGWRPEQGRML